MKKGSSTLSSSKETVSFFNLFLKLLLIQCVVGTAFFSSIYVWERRHAYAPYQTESILRVIPYQQNVDLLILGTSHGRIYSRNRNEEIVEGILQKRIVNASIGGGGGVIPAQVSLETFFARGNKTRYVIYFLDAWVFNSTKWNEDFFPMTEEEPLEWDFFTRLLDHGFSRSVLLAYFRSKLTSRWLTMRPSAGVELRREYLARRDPEAVAKRLGVLYQGKTSEIVFQRYWQHVLTMAHMIANQNAQLLLIMPPSLLGTEPDTELLSKHVNDLVSRSFEGGQMQVIFKDFSTAIQDPHLYYDHDHLNSAGIQAITENYLKPLFAELDEPAIR